MKVVVAVDSFKGSMTSIEAGMAVKAGVLAAHKDAEVIVKPLADGGEGTTDALIEGLNGERIDVTVTGPYHESVNAILWLSQGYQYRYHGNGFGCRDHDFQHQKDPDDCHYFWCRRNDS